MPSVSFTRRLPAPRVSVAAAVVFLGSVSLALHVASVLADERLATTLVSRGLWLRLVAHDGGISGDGRQATAEIDSPAFLVCGVAFGLFAWLAGGGCLAHTRGEPVRLALARWGVLGWSWCLLPLLWEVSEFVASMLDLGWATSILQGTLPLSLGLTAAGWLTTGCALAGASNRPERPLNGPLRVPASLWLAMALYVLIFSGMNVGLYFALNLPHGDSAMYEEHLWNLLHGKGFRSYLDSGRLFLGEHVQVIHLLLIPAYLLWPSHLLLEIAQSTALAAGAIPVYRLGCRLSGSTRSALWLAVAYLFYVPMQFLDVAVDFKTFRPNSFEIPLFLWGFDALERQRWRSFLAALGLALACQEDAATIIAPLGVWMAFFGPRASGADSADNGATTGLTPRGWRLWGVGLAVIGVVWVLLVIKVVLPWFRGGADVHFAQYFNELGGSTGSITANVIQHPGLVLRRLVDVESIGFLLALLAPLGFVPGLAPGRLAVAAPLFVVLCLSDITNSAQHHFHAPLVPVLFWAAAAGLGNLGAARNRLGRTWRWLRRAPTADDATRWIAPGQVVRTSRSLAADACPAAGTGGRRAATPVETAALWCALCSAATGLFLGLSPASIGFWDRGSRAWWRERYIPGERAARFPAVLARIPRDARVASTDYLHPRFTHYERSYDYSEYRPVVPDDTDYIVIDARQAFSRIAHFSEIREFRERPDLWEPVPDPSGGYFLVLRRRW